MKDDIKKLISGVRTLHNDQAIRILCDEMEKSLQLNEDTLAVKLQLHEENQRLRTQNEHLEATMNAVIEAAGEDWQDVDNLPNVVKAMADIVKHRQAVPPSSAQQRLQSWVSELQKPLQELQSLNNHGVPPLSAECLRQHAAMAAMQGLLAGKGWNGDYSELASNAVIAAETLAQELAMVDKVVPEGWEPCSPQWIERNGPCSCAEAPRIAFGPIGNHYHPHMYHNPQPVSVPDEHYKQLSELYHSQEKRLFKLAQRIKGPAFDKYSYSPSQAIDVLEAAIFGEDGSCRAAALNQTHVKQPSSNPKSDLLQSAEKLADDVGALAQRVDHADARAEVRAEHAEWATATFGNTGPVGPLKHLSAEALETAEAPDDLSEWADMQFLFWDAQRKAGITDEQITAAMVAKLEVNKARQWPEPKEGEPRFHIK